MKIGQTVRTACTMGEGIMRYVPQVQGTCLRGLREFLATEMCRSVNQLIEWTILVTSSLIQKQLLGGERPPSVSPFISSMKHANDAAPSLSWAYRHDEVLNERHMGKQKQAD